MVEVQAIAAHGSVALVAAEDIRHLNDPLATRTTISQATGFLAARYELSMTNAFELLKRYSSHQNRKISVIARELVAEHDGRHRNGPGRAPRPRPPEGHTSS